VGKSDYGAWDIVGYQEVYSAVRIISIEGDPKIILAFPVISDGANCLKGVNEVLDVLPPNVFDPKAISNKSKSDISHDVFPADEVQRIG